MYGIILCKSLKLDEGKMGKIKENKIEELKTV